VADLAEAIEQAVLSRPRLRHVQSVLVSVGGELRAECYFRGRRPQDLSNVHSITKSVVGTLVGIAVAEESLALDARVVDVLGTAPADPRVREITVRHLLTMTSGLDADGGWDIDEIADRGESWVEGPLAAPLVAEPGTAFGYNNGAAHVLSVVLARAAGQPLRELAEERLFGPLGVADYRWPTDPDGNPLGYGHLELRPRDLLELGRLYLDGGRDVVPRDYVTAATTAATGGGSPEETGYGYLWWVTDDAFFGGGFAGQYLYVVPSLQLAAVTTGDAAVWIPSSGSPRRLLTDVVVPAVAEGRAEV
jgi:CubicO group peptidase (beta-lactamase class C family)